MNKNVVPESSIQQTADAKESKFASFVKNVKKDDNEVKEYLVHLSFC